MMSLNIGYYLFALAAVIVAFLVIKRVASCLIKSVITLALVAVLVIIYYYCIR